MVRWAEGGVVQKPVRSPVPAACPCRSLHIVGGVVPIGHEYMWYRITPAGMPVFAGRIEGLPSEGSIGTGRNLQPGQHGCPILQSPGAGPPRLRPAQRSQGVRFERDQIRERVKSGMAAAKARGVVLGR